MPEAMKAVEASKSSSPTGLKLVPPADLFDRVHNLYDSVARRAFKIFENKGRSLGHEIEDWFKAESELLHPVHIDVAEADGNLKVRAETPGFAEKDLDVSLEGRSLTIVGKRETKEERKDEKTIYTESSSDQILRVIDLPEEVDAEKASATLKNGVLELTLPKAAPAKKIAVEAKTA